MKPEAVLSEIGRRLARARKAEGLSAGELARRAKLSRRYLAMAERGNANLSLLKIVSLARALKIPLRELCDVDVGDAPEMRIALLGLRGAGKSSVGRALAQRLEVPFFELDQLIEQSAGLRLRSIFEIHGEGMYRRHQREVLETWLEQHGSGVLAPGGSIVSDDTAWQRLRGTCRTVWLKARPHEHWQRVVDQGDRRLMQKNPRAMAELEKIFAEREPRYALADRTVLTSGMTPEGIADEIVSWLTI